MSDLPDDATVDDAIERLLFLQAIEDGLEDVRQGRTIPHDEAMRWLDEQRASRPK